MSITLEGSRVRAPAWGFPYAAYRTIIWRYGPAPADALGVIEAVTEPGGVNVADAQKFRQAWGKFVTGVALVTSIERDGGVHGMCANGINSVSLEPLLVLVSVGHNRESHAFIKARRRFAINVLCDDQKAIAEYYALPPESRTGEIGASFTFTKQGSAILDGCLASMDCRVVSEYEAGDHTLFIAEADDIQVNSGRPLIFFQGTYESLD